MKILTSIVGTFLFTLLVSTSIKPAASNGFYLSAIPAQPSIFKKVDLVSMPNCGTACNERFLMVYLNPLQAPSYYFFLSRSDSEKLYEGLGEALGVNVK